MYYEEKYESGIWYWRGTPDGEWLEMSKRQVCERLAAMTAWEQALVEQLKSPNRAESPIYREPTLEDAREVYENGWIEPDSLLAILKQLGFVRKVTPNE